MITSRRLRRARIGVFGSFFLNGFVLAMWIVNIPAVERDTHLTHAVLGSLLLLLGFGSFIAMQISGWLADRIGSRNVVTVGAILLILSINLPGMALNAWTLGIALFIFGLGNGTNDFAQNDQAVDVERRYGRPVMSAFHAFFSIGGAVGALVGAAVQAAGFDVHEILGLGSIIGVIIAAVSIPSMLPKSVTMSDRPKDTHELASKNTGGLGRRVLILALLSFLMMLAEGVANDWSALQATEHLHQAAAEASLAYGSFCVLMTIGRLSTDRIVVAIGSTNVVRFGAAIAAVGLLGVILSPIYILTLAGWGVFGLGLAGINPQVFTAAGNVNANAQGVILSRVVGAGYLGLLAGPAIIGWVSGGIGLTMAFLIPFAFCLIAIALAPVVNAHSISASTAEKVAQA